jgi:hypothetical protein
MINYYLCDHRHFDPPQAERNLNGMTRHFDPPQAERNLYEMYKLVAITEASPFVEVTIHNGR